MAECQNCGSFVPDQYAKVFTPRDVDQPQACPHCSETIRETPDVRES